MPVHSAAVFCAVFWAIGMLTGWFVGRFLQRRLDSVSEIETCEDRKLFADLKANLEKLLKHADGTLKGMPRVGTLYHERDFTPIYETSAKAQEDFAELRRLHEANKINHPTIFDDAEADFAKFTLTPAEEQAIRSEMAQLTTPIIMLPQGHSSNYPPPLPKPPTLKPEEGPVLLPFGGEFFLPIDTPAGKSEEGGPVLLPFGAQPPPQLNAEVSVWDLVIADMKKRDEFGRKKYGTPVQPFNGRKSLQDLYEELLDAVVYARQELEERAIRESGR